MAGKEQTVAKGELAAALLSLLTGYITGSEVCREKIILTFKDTEEKAVEEAIAALVDMTPLEWQM